MLWDNVIVGHEGIRDMEKAEILNDFFALLFTGTLATLPKLQKAKVKSGRRKICPL